MALVSGTRLGPYEILSPIGAGGMGEVYRARDTRLERHVAVKILAQHLLGGAPARERFVREARVIAALSHPNICTLYDVGHERGIDFLVMEYLEGETLADRLGRQGLRSPAPSRPVATPSPGAPARAPRSDSAGRSRAPLPIDEVVRIATQLADALAAAHRAGVVHRDLKPANVMLTKTGVKVLDFGLAKPLQEGAAPGQSATATSPLTDVGTIAGTLPYMAPEQLEGRDVDARTDLFAFGGIVYEMASGRRAFAGDSQASIIAAILDRDPEPLATLQPSTPQGLDRLVRKCLAKDPDARWQSASDLADELRWVSSGSGVTAERAARALRRDRRLRRAGIAAASLALVAIAVGTWKWINRTDPVGREVQHRQVTFAGDVLSTTLSPDGRTVAYAVGEVEQNARLLVRDVSGGQALEIWAGDYLTAASWMPDGSQIVLSGMQQGQRGIWMVPRLGGAPRRIAGHGPMVGISPDGTALSLAWQEEKGFRILSLKDGTSRPVKLNGFRWLLGLDWTSRGNRILLLTEDDDRISTVWSTAPEGGEANKIYSGKEPVTGFCPSPVADVVYVLRERSGTSELLSVPMDGRAGAPPRVLLSGLPMTTEHFASLKCSISADGQRLLYSRASRHANLWRYNLTSSASRATMLTHGTSLYAFPAVSPDGRWIAATEGAESQPEIVKLPIAGGDPIRLGSGAGPAWSPDGRRLAFVSDRSGSRRVWIIGAEGQSVVEVKDSVVSNPLVTWLPDGRLAWQTADARNYRIRDLASGRDELLVKDPSVGWVFTPSFSPNGDRVVVSWNRKQSGLWLLSWPEREERRLGLEPQGDQPIGWSADGEWIYVAPMTGRTLFRISARTGKREAFGSFPIGRFQVGSCSLTPDRAAVVCSLAEMKADAWVMEHFDREIP